MIFIVELINYKVLLRFFKCDNNSYKISYGKLLCIGGNVGIVGVICLIVEVVFCIGVGMVKVYIYSSFILLVSIGWFEIMVIDIYLISVLEWVSCIVIGFGFG